MLLPSALSCDSVVAVQRPQRPKLLSHAAYKPQPQDSYAGGLLASCRALHSILGGPPPQPQSSSQSQAQQLQPIDINVCARPSPFAPKRLSSPPRLATPPRGLNKRRRDEFEEEDEKDKENLTRLPQDRDLYQTPKRCRFVPLDMPLGLHADDFASLSIPSQATPHGTDDEGIEMPPMESDQRQQSSSNIPQPQSPERRSRRRSDVRLQRSEHLPEAGSEQAVVAAQEQWSPLDDRRLVEVVLSKLSLSKREWNDCAKQLGKDKDSLGRRWRILVGEGNIGLRRGLGRHERGNLDIKSW